MLRWSLAKCALGLCIGVKFLKLSKEMFKRNYLIMAYKRQREGDILKKCFSLTFPWWNKKTKFLLQLKKIIFLINICDNMRSSTTSLNESKPLICDVCGRVVYRKHMIWHAAYAILCVEAILWTACWRQKSDRWRTLT